MKKLVCTKFVGIFLIIAVIFSAIPVIPVSAALSTISNFYISGFTGAKITVLGSQQQEVLYSDDSMTRSRYLEPGTKLTIKWEADESIPHTVLINDEIYSDTKNTITVSTPSDGSPYEFELINHNEVDSMIMFKEPTINAEPGVPSQWTLTESPKRLAGSITMDTKIIKVSYKITHKDKTTVEKALSPTSDWSIENPDFSDGENLFQLTVLTTHGKKYKKLIKIIIAKSTYDKGDNDKDELSNWLENILGTDKTKSDTDGDGLFDGFEFSYLKTSLFMADTDKNGVSDSDEDFDNDELTNIQEQKLGTRPDLADTDGDGLTDYREVTTHKTDPLSKDTDNDTLTDEEELKLGLNPKNTKSDGVTPDQKRTFHQAADDSIKDDALIHTEKWLKPTISGTVAGDISKNIRMRLSLNEVFNENRSVLSDVIDVETSYKSPLTLSFSYSQDSKDSLKAFTIVMTSENGFDLIDTTVDEAKKTIYGEITGEGTYFVVDLNEFLKGLGINVLANAGADSRRMPYHTDGLPKMDYLYDNDGNVILEINSLDALKEESNNAPSFYSAPLSNSSASATGKADIAFVVDTTGSMSNTIRNIKNNINSFAEKLVNEYNVDANFSLVEFRDITVDGIFSTKQHIYLASNWFTNVSSFKKEISTLSVNGGGDTPETPIDGLAMARQLDWRSDASKFVVLVTDANYKNDNNFGISGMEEMASLFVNDKIIVSAITYAPSIYANLVNSTDGLYGYINGNFSTILLGLANKIGDVTVTGGEWVFLDDYQAVKLSGTLADAAATDSDSDGLMDASELGTCVERDMLPYINKVLDKYSIPAEAYTGKTKLTVWNYLSNPVKVDTDNDGLKDNSDTVINNHRVTPKDPEPRKADKMAHIWKSQISQAVYNNIQQQYQWGIQDDIENIVGLPNVNNFVDNIFQTFNLDENLFIEGLNKIGKAAITEIINFALSNRNLVLDNRELLTDIVSAIKQTLNFLTPNEDVDKIAADCGAFILNFNLDEGSVAYHSKPDTWQKAFGYNDLYDDAFDIGSSMRVGKLYFNYNGKLHLLWAWRGDYWNLGAGTEIGVYSYDRTIDGTAHYEVISFNLPMSLNLYSTKNSLPKHYFSWSPIEKQWWITGFNYRYQNELAGNLITVGCIDFSAYPDMYEQVKSAYGVADNNLLTGTEKLLDYSIFDNQNNTIWLMWYY